MVKSKTLKNKSSVAILIKLAKKYGITQSGSKKQIAERLSGLRGSYLSKTEKKIKMLLQRTSFHRASIIIHLEFK